VHPLIQAEFDAKKDEAQAYLTILQVCKYVAEHRGWGPRHRIVMRSSTAEDFEQLIRTLPVADLKILVWQMMEFLTKRAGNSEEFGFGADRFAEACRKIVLDQASGRLGKLIKAIFEEAKVPEVLQPPEARAVEAEPDAVREAPVRKPRSDQAP